MVLNIIPVIDVMNGVVVHAIAGKRSEYKPLRGSVIANYPSPEEVLRGFKKLYCKYVYIADLDAIMGKGANEFLIDIALSYGFTVLVDIGRKGLEKTDEDNVFYVIGTEYTKHSDELNFLFNRIISLDIKSGKVIFRNKELSIAQAAEDVCNRSPKLVIILNLDLVGTSLGIDLDVVKTVRDTCKVELAVGGGLRGVEELMILKELGVRYVLVATAIHRGVVNKCTY